MSKKELPAGARGMRASHPGEAWSVILKEGLRLSVTETAKRMGISRQRLHAVIRENKPGTCHAEFGASLHPAMRQGRRGGEVMAAHADDL